MTYQFCTLFCIVVSLSLSEECKLQLFQNKDPRKISCPKSCRHEIRGGVRI